MKTMMGALDIRAAVQECQLLVRGRVVKVYAGKEVIALAVHVPGKGKVWIAIVLPGFFFASKKKPEINSASPFQSALKKYVEGSCIDSIEQVGLDRVVRVGCSGKEGGSWIRFELFGSGNAVLGKGEEAITSLKRVSSEGKSMQDGLIHQGMRRSLWDCSPNEMVSLLQSKKQAALMLATNGMGAVWAKEVCLRAGIDPDRVCTPKDAERIAQAIMEVKKAKLDPRIILRNGEVIDVKPFPMKVYAGCDQQRSGFGEGIAQSLESTGPKQLPKNPELERVRRILEKQEEYYQELEKQAAESTRKGELVFEQYQLVKEILDELKKARERLSWKEIKQRLKGHPVIKEIHEENGEFVIEVG